MFPRLGQCVWVHACKAYGTCTITCEDAGQCPQAQVNVTSMPQLTACCPDSLWPKTGSHLAIPLAQTEPNFPIVLCLLTPQAAALWWSSPCSGDTTPLPSLGPQQMQWIDLKQPQTITKMLFSVSMKVGVSSVICFVFKEDNTHTCKQIYKHSTN